MAIVATASWQQKEEDSVHLLMSCTDTIQHGNSNLAGTIIEEMRFILMQGLLPPSACPNGIGALEIFKQTFTCI
ncbi:hypothetical protein COCNU_02G015550 [Cocos nucifera]|uniref:Uncharacterized protein n=1 Tax=Cocos nucifera TaxID=13894 RepID=A0A8K0I0Y2_COCNU|nr:hypothetical protein COCNU_02G015550 [Cocos nucifera]